MSAYGPDYKGMRRPVIKQGDKGYIPMYGWFGRLGDETDAESFAPPWYPYKTPMHWFHPAHAEAAYGRAYLRSIVVPITFVEPYEWLDAYELWKASRDRERALRGR